MIEKKFFDLGKSVGFDRNDSTTIQSFFQNARYEGQTLIADFLKNNGKGLVASTALPRDVMTGERLPVGYYVNYMESGDFYWSQELAYYVEKYNLRLPKEFENHVFELIGKSA